MRQSNLGLLPAFNNYLYKVASESTYFCNQLAVFLDLNNELSGTEMQAIAREINFAETAFITADKGEGRFVVRIFTPEYEVPFAGHPSLGTSFVICKFLLAAPASTLVLELAHADIEMSIADPHHPEQSIYYMRQTQPEFASQYTREAISQGLGIPLNHIHPSLPIQEISTGLPYILIPLNSLEAIENIALTYQVFTDFLKTIHRHKSNSPKGTSTSLFFFTGQTYEAANTYNARMFLIENEKLSEDAATGSANGCLLAYLLTHTHTHPQIKAVVEQGFQMKRKSYIYLDGALKNNQYEINVGGFSKLIAEGAWYL